MKSSQAWAAVQLALLELLRAEFENEEKRLKALRLVDAFVSDMNIEPAE